tara:strand:+ start:1174 stop:1407 length:234 start_codon:yes stop_codon:yes gene_type:complete
MSLKPDKNIRELILTLSKKEKISTLCNLLKNKDIGGYFTLSKIMIDIPTVDSGLTSDEVSECFNRCFKNYFTDTINK